MGKWIGVWALLLIIFPVNNEAHAWSILRLSDPYGDLQLAGWDMYSRDGRLQFDVDYTNCDISNSELNSAIDQAFDVWNKIPYSGIKLVRGDEVTSTAGSDPPSIFCDNDGTNGIASDGVAGVGGATSVNTVTGIILEGRLVLNANPAHSSRLSNLSEETRAIVVAHEVGHVMGFGHSSDDEALMYYNASAKNKLRLSQDDINAVMFMYPRDEFGPDAFLGCASVGTIGGGKGNSGEGVLALNFALLILAMLLSWVLARQRKPSYLSL